MKNLIECGNCGYPLTPEEQTGMVEVDDKVYTEQLKNLLELQARVKDLFNNYLNLVEESESGRMFNPITIGCCRVMMLEPLDNLLDRMRELSGAEANALYEDRNNGLNAIKATNLTTRYN